MTSLSQNVLFSQCAALFTCVTGAWSLFFAFLNFFLTATQLGGQYPHPSGLHTAVFEVAAFPAGVLRVS